MNTSFLILYYLSFAIQLNINVAYLAARYWRLRKMVYKMEVLFSVGRRTWKY